MEILNNIPQFLSILLALIGLIITIVGLPGVWLVFIGVLIWSAIDGFVQISWFWLTLFLLLTIASTFVDNVAVLLGAKKYGASGWGILGCILGLIVGGVIANIPGLLIGAFLGAVIFEMTFAKKDSNNAMRAGFGALMGFVISNLIKFIIALVIIIAWWLLAL
jgi:uncharacterized protein YqgC (DUF456 family)